MYINACVNEIKGYGFCKGLLSIQVSSSVFHVTV